MDYSRTLEFLFNSFPCYQRQGGEAYKPGLGRVESFCRSLGDPHKDYHTIHVAGTNGKGSVAHALASVLQSAGYRTGLYTSPHLLDFRERMRVDGRMISERAVVDFVDGHRDEMTALGLSFFEMTTALAFKYFSDEGVEVAVIETGLGGRLDATNIIMPCLSVITNIGLEHTEYLGHDIPSIAFEKAGIIKPGVPAVVGESDSLAVPVFIRAASECGASVRFADRVYECTACEPEGDGTRFSVMNTESGVEEVLELDLPGAYQKKNILTVRCAVEELRRSSPLSISRRALAEGCRAVVRSTGLMGRWQVLSRAPFTVCDTGHNAHGLKEVAAQLRDCAYDNLYVVFGAVREKDMDAILPLLPREAYYVFTQAAMERALDASFLTARAAAYGLRGETVPCVADAVARVRRMAGTEDMVFIGGSTFVVAEALPLYGDVAQVE